MQTEFVRSLNCNYERILLDEKPEERRYQYCIMNRGGIRGLLPCSLRYINGAAYLYYDISSKQNVKQLYSMRCIDRGWVKDFLWSLQQIRLELERFLLDTGNLLFFPEQVFQDLENHLFSFVYVPYFQGENGFKQMLEFWVDRIDYKDETLVECVYHMYEQAEKGGDAYLQARIFEDAERLNTPETSSPEAEVKAAGEGDAEEYICEEQLKYPQAETEQRKHFFGIFDGKKKRNKGNSVDYEQEVRRMPDCRAVAEETEYGENYGRTIYIEEAEVRKRHRELCTMAGKVLTVVDRPSITLGKRKGEADVVLDHMSVSRLHARITMEGDVCYIEDLNSTNGTFKNGLRLQPYEKRQLEEGDEIQAGRVSLIFR